MVLGPLGTDHRSPSRQFSGLQEVGQGLSTATLGHSPAKTPVQPTKPRVSALSLPPQGGSHHRPHLTTTSLQKPSAHPRANGNLLFFVLSVFPQVAFPCKMPDMTPEGNLGVGGAPQGAAQGLKYKLDGRAQVGQARDSTRDMASQVETKGLFFCRKKLYQSARG